MSYSGLGSPSLLHTGVLHLSQGARPLVTRIAGIQVNVQLGPWPPKSRGLLGLLQGQRASTPNGMDLRAHNNDRALIQ